MLCPDCGKPLIANECIYCGHKDTVGKRAARNRVSALGDGRSGNEYISDFAKQYKTGKVGAFELAGLLLGAVCLVFVIHNLIYYLLGYIGNSDNTLYIDLGKIHSYSIDYELSLMYAQFRRIGGVVGLVLSSVGLAEGIKNKSYLTVAVVAILLNLTSVVISIAAI